VPRPTVAAAIIRSPAPAAASKRAANGAHHLQPSRDAAAVAAFVSSKAIHAISPVAAPTITSVKPGHAPFVPRAFQAAGPSWSRSPASGGGAAAGVTTIISSPSESSFSVDASSSSIYHHSPDSPLSPTNAFFDRASAVTEAFIAAQRAKERTAAQKKTTTTNDGATAQARTPVRSSSGAAHHHQLQQRTPSVAAVQRFHVSSIPEDDLSFSSSPPVDASGTFSVHHAASASPEALSVAASTAGGGVQGDEEDEVDLFEGDDEDDGADAEALAAGELDEQAYEDSMAEFARQEQLLRAEERQAQQQLHDSQQQGSP
jgi:hypothetical protein